MNPQDPTQRTNQKVWLENRIQEVDKMLYNGEVLAKAIPLYEEYRLKLFSKLHKICPTCGGKGYLT